MDAQAPREDDDGRGTSWRAALLVALAGIAVWKYWVPRTGGELDPDAQPRAVAPRGDLHPYELETIALFERAAPSVVNVFNYAAATAGGRVELDASGHLHPADGQADEQLEGTGSGFVWDEAGHVITNYHVIHGADQLDVTLANHETYAARVVGREVEKDIAVLQIDAPASALHPLAVGGSADLKVGQSVYAIGSPFGLDQTLTAGIVSGLGREAYAKYQEKGRGQRIITDLIQTQAPINPGNSGGPLLDSAGRLIGMNTMIVSPSGASAGVGFAIPVDTINRVVTEILRYGEARRPSLGVQIAPDNVARYYKLPGVLVVGVVKGSGADAGGVRGEPLGPAPRYRPSDRSDVIVGVNGSPVRNSDNLFRELAHHEIGDKVKLDLLRAGSKVQCEVELRDLRS